MSTYWNRIQELFHRASALSGPAREATLDRGASELSSIVQPVNTPHATVAMTASRQVRGRCSHGPIPGPVRPVEGPLKAPPRDRSALILDAA